MIRHYYRHGREYIEDTTTSEVASVSEVDRGDEQGDFGKLLARLQDQNEEAAAAAGDEDAAGRPIAGEVEYDRAKAAYEREAR